MCGRYLITTPLEAIRRIFGVTDRPNFAARYNVAPTDTVPIVRLKPGETGRELVLVRWGLIPPWAKDMKIGASLINARADSLAAKPAFREAFERRRCLVVADGFYEWITIDGRKQPYLVRRRDRAPFAFAGLWSFWRDPEGQGVPSCTIVTTEANADLAAIHPRMPVVLEEADHAKWLDVAADAAPVLRPAREGLLEAVAVSPRVNSVKNDDPGVLEPAAEQPALL